MDAREPVTPARLAARRGEKRRHTGGMTTDDAVASDPPAAHASASRSVRLLLGGDLMTGRGIDQVLRRPVDPRLYESFIVDARDYVRLAERHSGSIPAPVDDAYPWGEALEVLADASPTFRVVNLETSITARGHPWPDKGVHYRMHPENIGCVTVARIDCVSLANNHVLDWGYAGLLDTLEALDAAGVRTAGAGRDIVEASAPAVLEQGDGARVLVFAYAHADSGVPPSWAATPERPGVALLPALDEATAEAIAADIRTHARPGDIVVASIHWGGNWEYEVPRAQRRFARALIDHSGVHVVHGHSSHHPKALEVRRGRLVLYGCGELIDDYEGIGGYEHYRSDLVLLHLPTIDPSTGTLVDLRLVPLRLFRFRLVRPTPADLQWVADTLAREYARFGARPELEGGVIRVRWDGAE